MIGLQVGIICIIARHSLPRRTELRLGEDTCLHLLMVVICLGEPLCLGVICLHLGEPESFSCKFFLLALVLPSFQSALLLLDFPSYSAKHCRIGD